jgi:hypothetical protein
MVVTKIDNRSGISIFLSAEFRLIIQSIEA